MAFKLCQYFNWICNKQVINTIPSQRSDGKECVNGLQNFKNFDRNLPKLQSGQNKAFALCNMLLATTHLSAGHALYCLSAQSRNSFFVHFLLLYQQLLEEKYGCMNGDSPILHFSVLEVLLYWNMDVNLADSLLLLHKNQTYLDNSLCAS